MLCETNTSIIEIYYLFTIAKMKDIRERSYNISFMSLYSEECFHKLERKLLGSVFDMLLAYVLSKNAILHTILLIMNKNYY